MSAPTSFCYLFEFRLPQMARVQVPRLARYGDNPKPGLFLALSYIQPLSDVYFHGVSSGDQQVVFHVLTITVRRGPSDTSGRRARIGDLGRRVPSHAS